MTTTVLQTPHRIYKRYQPAIESALTAFGLGFLVASVLVAVPVYPPNWAPVLVTLVILVGLRWPLAAYALASLAVLYPIYTISLYLAILFGAVSVLLHRPLSHYLGATVLILASPWLAHYHLHWLIPILAGLWWGAANGFWIGGSAALWGKLFDGMAGLDIDWLAMAGALPATAGLMQRYQNLDALEMLFKLIQPFYPDTTFLLYHLLQVLLWGGVGLLVGFLVERRWINNFYPWGILLTVSAGVAALTGGHLALPVWLVEAAPATINYHNLLLAAIFALVIAGALEIIRRFFELPVSPKPIQKRAFPAEPMSLEPASSLSAERSTGVGVYRAAPIQLPELPEWEPPAEDDDLILLELD